MEKGNEKDFRRCTAPYKGLKICVTSPRPQVAPVREPFEYLVKDANDQILSSLYSYDDLPEAYLREMINSLEANGYYIDIGKDGRHTVWHCYNSKGKQVSCNNNNVVISVENQYGEYLEFFTVPIGGVPVFNPNLQVRKINK